MCRPQRTACAEFLSLIPLLTYRSVARVASARPEGGRTAMKKSLQVWLPLVLVFLATLGASAQSFRVQCPTSTITHPQTGTSCSANPTNPGCNNTEPPYNGPTQFTRPTTGPGQYVFPTAGTVNGAIKCQQISGGDGYSTMADGTQTFMFSFGPLSGLADIAAGHAAT